MVIIQVDETQEDGLGDLADDANVDSACAAVDVVQRPEVHKLHHNANVRLLREAAIVLHNLGRPAIVHNLQLAHDLLANSRLGVDENELVTLSADFHLWTRHAYG